MKTNRGFAMKAMAAVVLGLAVQLTNPSEAMARPHPGSFERSHVVRGEGTDTWNVVFKGGERSQINIFGDGDSDLDLFVTDLYGNVITSAEGPNDKEAVAFVPTFTGTFLVKVRNLGLAANKYVIVFN